MKYGSAILIQYKRSVVEQCKFCLLSDCSNVGRPKQGMISLKSMMATMEALLLVVGKALIHPVVSMKTRRYVVHLTGGMLVKSTCQSDPDK
jgi:hypothetical protein